jgi:hypothetical protein
LKQSQSELFNMQSQNMCFWAFKLTTCSQCFELFSVAINKQIKGSLHQLYLCFITELYFFAGFFCWTVRRNSAGSKIFALGRNFHLNNKKKTLGFWTKEWIGDKLIKTKMLIHSSEILSNIIRITLYYI